MMHLVKAEMRILIRLRSVQAACLIAVLAVSEQFRAAVSLSTISGNGVSDPLFYLSQFLLGLIVLGNCAIIVIGGVLGATDFPWKTWGVKLSHGSRRQMVLAKILVVLFASLVVSSVIFIAGILASIGKGINAFTLSDLYRSLGQLVATIYILFYWGVMALTLCYYTESLAFGVAFCLIYGFLERLAATYLGSAAKVFLPVWNQNGFLAPLFSNIDNGSIIVMPDNYSHPLISLVVFSFYLVIAILPLGYMVQRRDYE